MAQLTEHELTISKLKTEIRLLNGELDGARKIEQKLRDTIETLHGNLATVRQQQLESARQLAITEGFRRDYKSCVQTLRAIAEEGNDLARRQLERLDEPLKD